MKRSLIVGCISSLAILSGLAACGKAPVACDGESLTNAAQACPDRASLGFAQEFNSGTFIGTSVPEAIRIQNGGIADLNITSATFSGDTAFTLSTEPSTLPATIKGNKNFFIRVLFAPTEAKLYTGKITVQSNAELAPSLEFDVSGCGVPTDGGTSPCYRDGGR
ncbi:MAG: hypothetical protein Q8N23_35110 [Archangium sp.]|nr:hypothetical protein [Archangium sp.]MDP3157954.1 hypothetical protein [Archangium sp.]MDP3574478.1 hypothetical protein [Archangium sp.]